MAAFGFQTKKQGSERTSGQKNDAEFNLIRRCQQGERQAQHEVYQQYKDWVFNVAYRMGNSQQDAEDITQQVFIRVFRKIDSFRGDSAFSSWLYRMAMNTCINHFHREKKRRERMTQQLPENENEQAKLLRDKQEQFTLKPHLEKAIRKLPEGYRAIFVLFDIEGYSHQEIGEMLSITEGTSKSQLHKARKELRRMLAPYIALESL